jgi:DNA-binding protein
MTKLPLAPIKRVAVEGGAQRIGIPAAEAIGLAAEEWIKRVTIAAEKYAIHAGRKTIKPEDIVIVVKDLGINIQIPMNKPKPKAKKTAPKAAPVATPPGQVSAPSTPQPTVPKTV